MSKWINLVIYLFYLFFGLRPSSDTMSRRQNLDSNIKRRLASRGNKWRWICWCWSEDCLHLGSFCWTIGLVAPLKHMIACRWRRKQWWCVCHQEERWRNMMSEWVSGCPRWKLTVLAVGGLGGFRTICGSNLVTLGH